MAFQPPFAGLEGLARLIAELGADPGPVLSAAGIDPRGPLGPDAAIPSRSFQIALGLAARATGRDDFGLMLAKRRTLETLGVLAPMVGSAPRVGDALQQLFRLLPYSFAGGVRAYVERRGPEAMLIGQVVLADPPALDQQLDHLAGAAVGLLRQLARPDWVPEAVYLSRRRPAHPGTYETYFGAPVLFGQEVTGIAIRSSLLDAPITRANLDLNRVLYAQLEARAREAEAGFSGLVRDRIWHGLGVGRCAAPEVAGDLGVPLRTFQRRLSQEGVSFSDLLDAARIEMAKRLMRHSDASLTHIATALGFAEPAVFSRFFRRQTDQTPSAWRARSWASAPAAPSRATGR